MLLPPWLQEKYELLPPRLQLVLDHPWDRLLLPFHDEDAPTELADEVLPIDEDVPAELSDDQELALLELADDAMDGDERDDADPLDVEGLEYELVLEPDPLDDVPELLPVERLDNEERVELLRDDEPEDDRDDEVELPDELDDEELLDELDEEELPEEDDDVDDDVDDELLLSDEDEVQPDPLSEADEVQPDPLSDDDELQDPLSDAEDVQPELLLDEEDELEKDSEPPLGTDASNSRLPLALPE